MRGCLVWLSPSKVLYVSPHSSFFPFHPYPPGERKVAASLIQVDLAVGLGHIQTNAFPTLAVTNKELDVRGLTRYTASCFPSAIDLLSRGVVDVKQLITKVLPLSASKEGFEAVASGDEIKVIIKNQEV